MELIFEGKMVKDRYKYLGNIFVHGKIQKHPETSGYESWVLMSTPLPPRIENGSHEEVETLVIASATRFPIYRESYGRVTPNLVS